jgi:preprotein translocase subunit SecA
LDVLSDDCIAKNLKFNRIDALNEHKEELLIATAGMPMTLTLATTMPGRGTDILLGGDFRPFQHIFTESEIRPYIEAYRNYTMQRGLQIILYGLHGSRKLEYQLRGRTGRQGQPGDVFSCFTIEDRAVRQTGAKIK